MYYDDGWDEIANETESNSDIPKVRLFKLSNGDVIQVNNLLLEFEDEMLHEVVKVTYGIFNPKYERTGSSYTPQQINEMVARDMLL